MENLVIFQLLYIEGNYANFRKRSEYEGSEIDIHEEKRVCIQIFFITVKHLPVFCRSCFLVFAKMA